MNAFTVENQDKLVAGLQKVLSFTAQHTPTGEDNLIIGKVQAAIEGIDLDTPVTEDDLIDAVFDIAESITSVTETTVDDAIVSTGHSLVGGKGKGGLLALIKGAIAIKHAHKVDAAKAEEAPADTTDTTDAAPAE